MPSKGVDYYSYIALDSTSIAFSGPNVGSMTTSANNFMKSHLEVDLANLPLFTFDGIFEWDVMRSGVTIASREQEINALTGNLGSGDFTMMMNTPAVEGADYTITYGFYEAGSGVAGLTDADQAWVTVVPKFSDWMGDVAPVNSSEEEKPFSTFVLAAAHDGGMNTLSGIDVVTDAPAFEAFIGAISALLPIPGISTLLVADAVNIMEDLAMTQKDSFTSMLDNGVRYFDFRPAYLASAVRNIVAPMDNTLYHTHLIIPGARFDAFLSEVVSFLLAHPTEFVTIRTSADGIEGTDIPDAATITSFANAALAGTNVQLGGSAAFQTPIKELRASGTRLILVQDNPKYDSYSDAAYATLDPSPIVASFANMTTAGQAGNDFTVLQCQGTSTSITDVLIYGALVANGSTSTLMATKAQFDMTTLPWIRENALTNLEAPQNIIIMNDFIDGATTHTAYLMSQARFAGETSVPVQAAAVKSREAGNTIGSLTMREKEKRMGKDLEETGDLAKHQDAIFGAGRKGYYGKDSKSPEQQLASAQSELEKHRLKEGMLKFISQQHSMELKTKNYITKDDMNSQAVLMATQEEAEDIGKAHDEALSMSKKRMEGIQK